MTNYERALEIISRACEDMSTGREVIGDMPLYRGFRSAFALATADEKSAEYFRGFTQALYFAGAISAEDRDILRVAVREGIPAEEGVKA